jgi:hypothetical protein
LATAGPLVVISSRKAKDSRGRGDGLPQESRLANTCYALDDEDAAQAVSSGAEPIVEAFPLGVAP